MLFDKLYFILTPIILAFISVGLFNQYLKKMPDKKTEYIEGISKFISNSAIGVLLPIIFFESLVSNIDNIDEIGKAFLIGFILPTLTLISGYVSLKVFNFQKVDKASHILGATFGGGSRGVALMLIVSSLVLTEYKKSLAIFYSIDFGNFLFFLVVIPIWLKLTYQSTEESLSKFKLKNLIKEIGFPNIFILGSALILVSGFGRNYANELTKLLEVSSHERSFLLLYLSFSLIFLKVELKTSVSKIFHNVAFITINRFLSFILISIFLYHNMEFNKETILSNIYFIPLLVLCVCPPSSLAGAQFEKYANQENTTAFVYAVHLTMLLLYLLLILIVFIMYFVLSKGF